MANQTPAALETNTWYKSLRYILYAILVMPLLVWSGYLFPFITTKVIFFRIAIEIALGIYVFLAFRYPELRPRWNWLTALVWIYFAVVIVASVFGVNFSKSFLGTIERGEGILTMLHFAVYFTMLPAVFRDRRSLFWYVFASVVVTFVSGLIGLLQLTEYSIVQGQGSRIAGTIGNAAFFAAFMLFGVFLSFYLLRNLSEFAGRKTNVVKGVLWVVIAVELFALYQSQTRGAIVAMAAAAVLYALVSLFMSSSRRTRAVSGLVIVLIILSGFGLYAARDSSFVQSSDTLHRFATISLTDITTQSRFDTWNASWQGWQDSFFFGYGYENFNIAFNEHFPARIFKDQGSQIWFDRAHNIIFDIGLTSGIIGLLAYLGIFAAAFVILYRLRNKIGWRSALLLGTLLVAYFIQNFFVFDTQATYLMFFLVLAFIAFLWEENRTSEIPAQTGKSFHFGFVPGLALGIALLAAAYFTNIQPSLANQKAIDAVRAALLKEYRAVRPGFENSLSYGTYMDEEIRQRMADYANESLDSGQLSPQEQHSFYKYVISEFEKSIAESPLDVKNYIYLMTIYNRATRFDSGYPGKVIELSRKAIELSGTRPQIYFEIGQAYFHKQEFDKGLAEFQKSIDLVPNTKEAHFNYAVASILSGREQEAEARLETITEELDYQLTSSDYLILSRAYQQNGNHQKVIETLQSAITLSPKSPNLLAQLAAAYGQICDLTGAADAVDKAVELDESFALEARQFLNELQANCQ